MYICTFCSCMYIFLNVHTCIRTFLLCIVSTVNLYMHVAWMLYILLTITATQSHGCVVKFGEVSTARKMSYGNCEQLCLPGPGQFRWKNLCQCSTGFQMNSTSGKCESMYPLRVTYMFIKVSLWSDADWCDADLISVEDTFAVVSMLEVIRGFSLTPSHNDAMVPIRGPGTGLSSWSFGLIKTHLFIWRQNLFFVIFWHSRCKYWQFFLLEISSSL